MNDMNRGTRTGLVRMPKTPALDDFRRIVVKVGSALLVDAKAGCVKEAWLASRSGAVRLLTDPLAPLDEAAATAT